MVTPTLAPHELIQSAPLTDSLRVLAASGDLRRYAKGTLLIDEGERGDTLFIILAGKLRAFSTDPDSAREVTYGVYGPGDYLGEMGLDGQPRSASVITLESSICTRIERPLLESHIRQYPDFAFELITRLIRRTRAATMNLRQIALNDVYGRLKYLLESLAVEQPNGSRLISEPLTHRDLAARLGCGREMVSRVMKDLERGEFLQSDTKRICADEPSSAGAAIRSRLPSRVTSNGPRGGIFPPNTGRGAASRSESPCTSKSTAKSLPSGGCL